MTVNDYAALADARPVLGEATWDSTRDDAPLQTLLTTVSRFIDRETDRSPGFWAPTNPVTVLYSGTGASLSSTALIRGMSSDFWALGSPWLTIDPFDTITTVTMCQAQDRSDVVTLDFSSAQSNFYCVKHPVSGPPYDRLYSGTTPFYPDRFHIGNVSVTGNRPTLPPELKLAACLWAAHLWKARKANFANLIIQPDGSAIRVSRKVPDDVKEILSYFQEEERRVLFV